MRVLLTAFDPFGGETLNPAEEALKLVQAPEGVMLYKAVISTGYRRSEDEILGLISEISPDTVICLGQAGGRRSVTPERIAVNIDDATKPDNAGEIRRGTRICENGPAAYFSTLPVETICMALNDEGIESSVSNSAGTFVCNHLMYTVLRIADTDRPGMRAGFIHVPYIPEQLEGKSPGTPSMELGKIVRGIEIALKICAQ